ncbi:MAG: hypothetical protein RR904_06625 [Bacilli bacterium]
MNKTFINTIDYYKEYLQKKNIDINDVNINTKTLENIKHYEVDAKLELEKLEYLSEEYKLYDSDYNEFMIAMGKLAIGLYNIKDLSVDNNNEKMLIDIFLDIHYRFESLEQRNIMKDVYIWKYLKK